MAVGFGVEAGLAGFLAGAFALAGVTRRWLRDLARLSRLLAATVAPLGDGGAPRSPEVDRA